MRWNEGEEEVYWKENFPGMIQDIMQDMIQADYIEVQASVRAGESGTALTWHISEGGEVWGAAP
jgi:hypothetical protein